MTDQDGNPPSSPVPVKVTVAVDVTSGGHVHGESFAKRDKGKVTPSDGTNTLNFTFASTEVSGTHTITATCDLCSNGPQTAKVDVMVDGLKPIPDFPFYTLVETNGDVIGATDLHNKNHNLLPAAAGVLMRIAVDYHLHPKFRVLDWQTHSMVPPPLLHINDASLEWGGKFDIKGKWTGSHAEHRRGTSVDLRANEMVGAIPPELFEEFEQRLGKIIAGDRTKRKFLRECTPNEKPSESNPQPDST